MENHPNKNRKASIWHEDPPTISDKLINYVSGLTKFRQADFTSLAKGGAICISVSLYPPEKEFFAPLGRTGPIADVLTNLVSGIGKLRINHIQKFKSYWNDLEREYDFLQQGEGRVYKILNEKFSYYIVNSFQELQGLNKDDDINRIGVILSIEGMHVLDGGPNEFVSETNVLSNVEKLKSWKHNVFFVTLAHHFFNGLGGHAESLGPGISKLIRQTTGLDEGFTDLGRKVIHALLTRDNGSRIPIDIKHMSLKCRLDYYDILKNDYTDDPVPLIVSHGAVNGVADVSGRESIPHASKKFFQGDINFYDFEILKVAESGGIFGLQLDERRIASREELDAAGVRLSVRKMRFYRSRLLWNQIQHIAEILDLHNRFAWDIQALGTDFDGIIDPLNGYWTANYFPLLESYLLMHAHNYIKEHKNKLKPFNRIHEEEIIDRFFVLNGQQFLKRWYV